MGSLYRNDLNRYKRYFIEVAKLLGIDINYRYIIKRKSEKATGESIYSKLSEPIKVSVVVEQGNPMVDSLKRLGWFVDSETEQLLVDFPVDTPNLQEGCRFSFVSNENNEQQKEYIIKKLSNEALYPTCIKCLCEPVLENESVINSDNEVEYGQRDIVTDTDNYSFINEQPELKFF